MSTVLITGASGFVGQWLTRELVAHGHAVVALDGQIDVRDGPALTKALVDARPDAVAHLAAVSYSPDATADPQTALAVAVGGTVNVLEALRVVQPSPVLLVTGSSEVYGSPMPDDLPLSETSPLRAQSAYGLSKLAQESVALAYANRYGLRVIVTRSFNHSGPGQRPDFVVPALAGRVLDFAEGRASSIRVGNLDVRRDLSDVRDVVGAYRLLIESGLSASIDAGGVVVNVCSGETVSIRWIAEELCRLAGVDPNLQVDAALVRPSDAPEIRGDYSLLTRATGWQPQGDLAATLRDVWADLKARSDGAARTTGSAPGRRPGAP